MDIVSTSKIQSMVRSISINHFVSPSGVHHRADLRCLRHHGQCQYVPDHAAAPTPAGVRATQGGAPGPRSAPQRLPLSRVRATPGHHRQPQIPGLCHQRGAPAVHPGLWSLPHRHADLRTRCKSISCCCCGLCI